jgi:hypothetical protein
MPASTIRDSFASRSILSARLPVTSPRALAACDRKNLATLVSVDRAKTRPKHPLFSSIRAAVASRYAAGN